MLCQKRKCVEAVGDVREAELDRLGRVLREPAIGAEIGDGCVVRKVPGRVLAVRRHTEGLILVRKMRRELLTDAMEQSIPSK